MSNRIHNTFHAIHASDEMVESTCEFLREKINSRRFPTVYRCVLALCSLLILFIAGGFLYQVPVSYISIDINPSIELSVNPFNRIIDVKGFNDDGSLILSHLDLQNQYYTNAVETVLADEEFLQYLDDNYSLIFTVVSKNEQTMIDSIMQCRGYEKSHAQCHGSSKAVMNEAHHSNMSFGKYSAYLELLQLDPTLTPEECSKMSMHEIHSLIAEHTAGDESDNNTSHSGKKHHHH